MIALDPDVLRSFIAIAEQGGFARAGEVVHKTQSTVSMQMKRLEETLGVPVFKKDGRRNVLTPDGERLLEYAHRLVKLNDEAVQVFRQPELVGSARIGTPDDYAEAFLPEILGRFCRTHCQVEVTVVCQPSLTLAQMVRDKELDVAIVSCDEGMPAGEVVRREPLHWVTSNRHCVHLEPVLPLALSQLGCAWRKIMLETLESSGRPYRIAYTSSNGAAIAAAVTSGLAVTAFPLSVLRPNMRVLTEADGFPPLNAASVIGMLRQSGPGNPVTDALAKHVSESLALPGGLPEQQLEAAE